MTARFFTSALLVTTLTFVASPVLSQTAPAEIDPQDFETVSTLATGDRTTGTYVEIAEASRLSARQGDLKDIIVSSFEYHPQLKSLRAQVRASRENVMEARASYLPQIALDSTASISDREATL